MDGGFDELNQLVINRGLCTGCGTCAAICSAACLTMDDRGEPIRDGECIECGNCLRCCPGHEIPMSSLERAVFGRTRDDGSELGVYKSFSAGYALDASIRRGGTSGGLVTALLLSLLEAGEVSGAVVTAYSKRNPLRAAPVLCRTAQEIVEASQSKYMVTAQNEALKDAVPNDRLALVALPCQVAGLRKAQVGVHTLKSTRLVIGLYCMSNFYWEATKYLIEEVLGLVTADVTSVAFRAGEYPGAFAVTVKDGTRFELPHSEAIASYPMFRPYRCMVCLDWTAELADLSVGDYWLESKQGFSSVLIRNDTGREAVELAQQSKAIHLEPATEDVIYRGLGFRYKKRGNARFVREVQRHGLPCPAIT